MGEGPHPGDDITLSDGLALPLGIGISSNGDGRLLLHWLENRCYTDRVLTADRRRDGDRVRGGAVTFEHPPMESSRPGRRSLRPVQPVHRIGTAGPRLCRVDRAAS